MYTMRMKGLQTPFIQVIGLCEIVWNEGQSILSRNVVTRVITWII